MVLKMKVLKGSGMPISIFKNFWVQNICLKLYQVMSALETKMPLQRSHAISEVQYLNQVKDYNMCAMEEGLLPKRRPSLERQNALSKFQWRQLLKTF